MKRTLLYVLLATTAFTACKKSGPDAEDQGNPYELPYSKEGITADKAFLENEGREFVKQIGDMSDLSAMEALQNMSYLGSPGDFSITTRAALSIGRSPVKVAAINRAIHQIAAVGTTTETYHLSKGFGIYTYDDATGDWAKTTASDKIEFRFPASESSTTNDAVLTITYKASGNTARATGEEWNDDSWEYEEVNYEYELPSELNASMTINGNSVMKLISTYSYHSDNLPKSADVSLTLDDYTFHTTVNNDTKEAEINFSLKKGNTALMSAKFGGKSGSDFTYENFRDISQNGNEDDMAEFISAANVGITVGNVKIAGMIDTKGLNQEMKKVGEYSDYDSGEAYDKAYATTFSEALNKNTAFALINGQSNERIASLEFDVEEEVGEYSEETYYYTRGLLVFGDGSKVTFEEFGETGFDSLIRDLEELQEKFYN